MFRGRQWGIAWVMVGTAVFGAPVLAKTLEDLEAQQRYFSYRAILVAIVSQNSLLLVFMGYRTDVPV